MAGLKWNKDFALEQAADDTELLKELIEIFKESCTNDFNQIREGVVNCNASQISNAAHSIKALPQAWVLRVSRKLLWKWKKTAGEVGWKWQRASFSILNHSLLS